MGNVWNGLIALWLFLSVTGEAVRYMKEGGGLPDTQLALGWLWFGILVLLFVMSWTH